MQPSSFSPARLTVSATLKLPRWAISLLCLLYILPGLIGRDIWKQDDDAVGFGVMWTMAHGNLHDWLVANVAGAPITHTGNLMYWTGAASLRMSNLIFGGALDEQYGARLAIVFLFLVGATALWYATYLLGRRAGAQPLALAFGGQPEPRDYGRVLADGALLILLATLGLVLRVHETSSDVATLAMQCAALYGMARSLDEPRVGALWVGLGLLGVALACGPTSAIALGILWIALILFHREWRQSRLPSLGITLPVVVAGLAIWPLVLFAVMPNASDYFAERTHFWLDSIDGIGWPALVAYARNLPWFTLPGGPLAVWALWSWRKQITRAHIVLPTGYLVAIGVVLLSTSSTEDSLPLMLLPGVAMLAAMGLPTLKRGAANAVDWFSLLIYSTVALALWLSWATRMFGYPASYATSIGRQVPGLAAEFQLIPFICALAVSAAWIWLVRWRVTTHPKVLWRSVVLASGGVMLMWTLTMTLFLHEVNFSRSYGDVANRLHAALAASPKLADQCVQSDGVGLAQRASFAYFGAIPFVPMAADGSSDDSQCSLLLRQDLIRAPRPEQLPPGKWTLLWEGRRTSDRNERFRLFHRTGGPAPVNGSAHGR